MVPGDLQWRPRVKATYFIRRVAQAVAALTPMQYMMTATRTAFRVMRTPSELEQLNNLLRHSRVDFQDSLESTSFQAGSHARSPQRHVASGEPEQERWETVLRSASFAITTLEELRSPKRSDPQTRPGCGSSGSLRMRGSTVRTSGGQKAKWLLSRKAR